MKRKIGVVTGSRAEYGYLRPLIKEILKHPKLDLFLYLTGMHLLKEYGEVKGKMEELMRRWEYKQEELESAKRGLEGTFKP